jgi:signal transduction histidine kinase
MARSSPRCKRRSRKPACKRVGIAMENQERIFERFERAVSARNYGSLGLGLWIARSIVVAAGGEMRVQSAPNAGSTFDVVLPRNLSSPCNPH